MLNQIYGHLVAPKIAMACASAAARRRGLSAFRVIGSNMAPTLEAKDIAWYCRLDSPSRLRRAQAVALATSVFGTAVVPSRIVAFPGETVEIREGELFVDGIRVPQPYVQAGRAEQDYSRSSAPVSVPRDHVWVLGDFRDMSKDSRHIGAIGLAAVLGRITHAHAPGQHASPREIT